MPRFRPALLLLVAIAAVQAVAGPLTVGHTVARARRQSVASDQASDSHGDLTPEQEQAMTADIQRNVAALRARGMLPTTLAAQPVALSWPLRMAPGLPDIDGFRVSAFVDHNPAGGQVLDYSGGTRTYDSHRGTDYALSPFSWNKLDAGAVQVVAAADGTIVAKANADPTDHNCLTSSPDPWNYVALVHADGHMTIYGHMRYNSLTSKPVGAAVARGEVLGTAASSGDSSGPHMHFEVRQGGFSNTEWVDPYAGPASQPGSLWASQRPYLDSAINLVAAHDAPPSTPDPCQPTVTHLQDSFTAPATVYLYTYYRDYQGALPTQLTVYRPDGSVFQSSQYAPGAGIFSSAWSNGWVASIGAQEQPGTWRFEASYNGQVAQTFFNVNAPPAIALTSPVGGEQWDQQLPRAITWADNIGGDVTIALYRNGAYVGLIAASTPSDGEYLWSPGAGVAIGSGYTVKVSSVIDPAVAATSGAPFSIVPTNLTNHVYLPAVAR